MSKTTNNAPGTEAASAARNEAVKAAYLKIVNGIKEALPKFPTEYLRTMVEVNYESLGLTIKHGLFSPMVHVQLVETDENLVIQFSRNPATKPQVGNYLDGLLSRIVYNNTAEANTTVNIEDALSAEIYKVDDFRQANSLLLKGYKSASKVTV